MHVSKPAIKPTWSRGLIKISHLYHNLNSCNVGFCQKLDLEEPSSGGLFTGLFPHQEFECWELLELVLRLKCRLFPVVFNYYLLIGPYYWEILIVNLDYLLREII